VRPLGFILLCRRMGRVLELGAWERRILWSVILPRVGRVRWEWRFRRVGAIRSFQEAEGRYWPWLTGQTGRGFGLYCLGEHFADGLSVVDLRMSLVASAPSSHGTSMAASAS
jgi:hypothetical protein